MRSGKRGHITKNLTLKVRGVTPKQAISLLQKKGIDINEKEAEKLLDIMYFLAKLVVNQNFKL